MNVTLSSFRAMAETARSGSRDVVLGRDEGMGVAKLGRLGRWSVMPHSKAMNRATMEAFRASLERSRGEVGTGAFDRLLGERAAQGKSLRARDIRVVLAQVGELDLQAVDGRRFAAASGMHDYGQQMRAAFRVQLRQQAGFEYGESIFREARSRELMKGVGELTSREVEDTLSLLTEWDPQAVGAEIDRQLEADARYARLDAPAKREVRVALRSQILDRLDAFPVNSDMEDRRLTLERTVANLREGALGSL